MNKKSETMITTKARTLTTGSTVFMTAQQARDNYGIEYIGKPLHVQHIATSEAEHPGFCPETGNLLFDFDELDFSLYEWEIQKTNPLDNLSEKQLKKLKTQLYNKGEIKNYSVWLDIKKRLGKYIS